MGSMIRSFQTINDPKSPEERKQLKILSGDLLDQR